MRRPAITDNQLLLILEMCFDAEERCDERIEKARDAGDYRAAADAVQLREQYEDLKQRVFSEMKSDGTTTSDLHQQLRGFSRLFGHGQADGSRS